MPDRCTTVLAGLLRPAERRKLFCLYAGRSFLWEIRRTNGDCMFRSIKSRIILAGACAGSVVIFFFSIYALPGFQASRIIAAYEKNQKIGGISISNPFNESIFPPEIIAPTFRWNDTCLSCDRWLVSVRFDGAHRRMNFFVEKKQWRPLRDQWESMKKLSTGKNARVTIIGFCHAAVQRIISAAEISFSTSKDRVDNPIFYREVNLPFGEAIKDPSRIRWRFGTVSQELQPPIVLEKLPVCGNCHSFSADAKMIGMDVDYGNDKGAYAFTRVGREMALATSDIITWSDYRREDKGLTFGLLSQISPDGRYVVSTVRDMSVFLARPDLAFSQLFFPIKGILVVYSREDRTFRPLPGADDTDFVQSNPSWSPDGKYIVFARSRVYHLPRRYSFRLTPSEEDCSDFLENRTLFKFDLYRIPFNKGKGGRAESVRGASQNDMSNYFAKYSPDGKWIVFCKAKTFMLLQPDSRLFIMPAEGGDARLMRCNTSLMNSWHSWSSNSRWLVFSSKTNTPYTQLFITHIDENGSDAAPVLLEQFTWAAGAANIPEFVNAPPGSIVKIQERFIDDVSLWRSGKAFEEGGDDRSAAEKFRAALALNPKNADAHLSLGSVLERQGNMDRAFDHYSQALSLDSSVNARIAMANALRGAQKYKEAVVLYQKALQQSPREPFALYNLALTLYRSGNYKEALPYYMKAREVEPKDIGVWCGLANTLLKLGNVNESLEYFKKAISLAPDDAALFSMYGNALLRAGRLAEADKQMKKALTRDPSNPEYLFYYANILLKQKRVDEAVRLYSKAFQLRPDFKEASDSLAIALRQKNRVRTTE